MADVTVYFATNRVPSGPPDDWRSYGVTVAAAGDPTAITYAAAFVQGVKLAGENSGAIVELSGRAMGSFAPEVAADLLGGNKDLLVFLHGFANSFEDSLKRAAYNREWFAASPGGGGDTTVLAFSWPSLGQSVALPPHMLDADYLADQARAGQSAGHIAHFLNSIAPLLRHVRAKGRRVFLLAHSMGHFALQGAVETWFAQGNPAEILFDETFLAAGDERSDSFELPGGARLSRLPELTSRISIYHSVRDIAMYFAVVVNHRSRLGQLGPDNRTDTSRYPPARIRIVDCAEVGDYPLLAPLDASHQYYRRSAKARNDIAAAMRGDPDLPGGIIQL